MKRILLAVVGLASLSGCAADYYGPRGPGPVAYGGFYDDYYGPIYDGYWGRGDLFYYRTRERGRFVPDRGRHFRRDIGPPGAGGRGFHEFHGNFTPRGGGFRPHGGGRRR